MDDRELDNLLNAPLAPIRDAGFSARLHSRLMRRTLAVRLLKAAVLAACILPALFFVSPALGVVTEFLVKVLPSPILTIAAAALILTFSAERLLSSD